jgi:site-specific DNA-cytosine methylase
MGLNKKESSNIEGTSLKAFGLISGVGSLLYGARKAGFEIVGNCDWRKYYHTGSFEHNFNKPFTMDLYDYDITNLRGLTMVMGHPECGNFSNLRAKKMDPTNALDIPKFVKEASLLQPQFILMDDLPRSLLVYGLEEYKKHLGDYDLSFEWVSNWGYGNVRKFLAGEKKPPKETRDYIMKFKRAGIL